MYMLMVMLMAQMFSPGVRINNPNSDRFTLTRTDQGEPHHPILDDPNYARLRPFMVTLKSKEPISIVTIQWDVVAADGTRYSFPRLWGMTASQGFIVNGNSSCEFWPEGRLNKDIKGHPMMHIPTPEFLDLLEHAKSVTVFIDFVQFADGTTAGPDTHHSLQEIAKNPPKRGPR